MSAAVQAMTDVQLQQECQIQRHVLDLYREQVERQERRCALLLQEVARRQWLRQQGAVVFHVAAEGTINLEYPQ